MERNAGRHKDQHAILEELTHHDYSGIDDRSKIRYLVARIKTSELDSVTATIMANPTLRTDFQTCVALYKEFIANKKPFTNNQRKRHIAAVKTEEGILTIEGGRNKSICQSRIDITRKLSMLS
mmetsp:Transcript_22891/g.32765  ORF Transcript_22891/g.32765 Transcript_22891/m.32765 type:complete len:123 (-) Transcript_22891:2363-2731(-)